MEIREYHAIRQQICGYECNSSQLNQLKDHYRTQIRSDRVMDKIVNLNFLFKILERRDIVNPEKLEEIEVIKGIVNTKSIENRYQNLNGERRGNFDFQFQFVENPSQNYPLIRQPVLPIIPRETDEQVFNLICTEIGKKWKDLGRSLKIPEGKIDELEIIYRTCHQEAVREILRYHKDTTDERYWRMSLWQGLEDARRKDLSYKVQAIFQRGNR